MYLIAQVNSTPYEWARTKPLLTSQLVLQSLQNFYGPVAFVPQYHYQKHSAIPQMIDIKYNAMILQVLQIVK